MISQRSSSPAAEMVYRTHDALRAHYDKLMESRELLDHVRVELDGLKKLGDAVSLDDVMKASGRLVGHGFGAANMAELLTSLPQGDGGAPLAAWIAQHDLDVTGREEQMDRIQNGLGHHLAVAAMRGLAMRHLEEPAQGAPPPPGGSEQPIQSGGLSISQNSPTMGTA
jgi:hypothetical protein